jgi:hypothetical protein
MASKAASSQAGLPETSASSMHLPCRAAGKTAHKHQPRRNVGRLSLTKSILFDESGSLASAAMPAPPGQRSRNARTMRRSRSGISPRLSPGADAVVGALVTDPGVTAVKSTPRSRCTQTSNRVIAAHRDARRRRPCHPELRVGRPSAGHRGTRARGCRRDGHPRDAGSQEVPRPAVSTIAALKTGNGMRCNSRTGSKSLQRSIFLTRSLWLRGEERFCGMGGSQDSARHGQGRRND